MLTNKTIRNLHVLAVHLLIVGGGGKNFYNGRRVPPGGEVNYRGKSFKLPMTLLSPPNGILDAALLKGSDGEYTWQQLIRNYNWFVHHPPEARRQLLADAASRLTSRRPQQDAWENARLLHKTCQDGLLRVISVCGRNTYNQLLDYMIELLHDTGVGGFFTRPPGMTARESFHSSIMATLPVDAIPDKSEGQAARKITLVSICTLIVCLGYAMLKWDPKKPDLYPGGQQYELLRVSIHTYRPVDLIDVEDTLWFNVFANTKNAIDGKNVLSLGKYGRRVMDALYTLMYGYPRSMSEIRDEVEIIEHTFLRPNYTIWDVCCEDIEEGDGIAPPRDLFGKPLDPMGFRRLGWVKDAIETGVPLKWGPSGTMTMAFCAAIVALGADYFLTETAERINELIRTIAVVVIPILQLVPYHTIAEATFSATIVGHGLSEAIKNSRLWIKDIEGVMKIARDLSVQIGAGLSPLNSYTTGLQLLSSVASDRSFKVFLRETGETYRTSEARLIAWSAVREMKNDWDQDTDAPPFIADTPLLLSELPDPIAVF